MRIDAPALTDFVVRLLKSAGVQRDEARLVAESLVDSDLCGHESHGVVRVPDYLAQIRAGELRPSAELAILNETSSLLVADAGFGFGQVQCGRMIERLAFKARDQGVACGTMRNCGHVGRLGEWCERLTSLRLAGLVAVNDNGVLTCVAPPGGVTPVISTNPIAIGAPTGAEPLVLDISTSAVANGKVRVAQLAGERCPPGWLQDAEGRPTDDPAARFAEPCATLLPMGGEQGHKGFGLGLLLDILAAGLSGGFCPPAPSAATLTNNVLMIAFDPARFAGAAHFEREASKLIRFTRDSQRKPGVAAIRLPGDRANASRRLRAAEGVPLDAGVWNQLVEAACANGVELPAAIS